MVSETAHDLTPSRGGRLLTTLRDHWLALLVTGLIAFVAAFSLLSSAAAGVLVPSVEHLAPGEPIVVAEPLDLLLFTAELAGGVAVGVVALLLTVFAFRDAGALRPGTRRAVVGPLALAGLLSLVGVGLGVTLVLPAVGDLLASGTLSSGFRPAYHPVWSAELVVFLPAVVGTTLALPAVMVGAVRGGVVRSQQLGSRWPVALLAAVLVGALFSPPDSVTFAPYVGLLLTGYGVGTVVGSSAGVDGA